MNDDERRKIVIEELMKKKRELPKTTSFRMSYSGTIEPTLYKSFPSSVPLTELYGLSVEFSSEMTELRLPGWVTAPPFPKVFPHVQRACSVTELAGTGLNSTDFEGRQVDRTFIVCDDESWFVWSAQTDLNPQQSHFVSSREFAKETFGDINEGYWRLPLSAETLVGDEFRYRALLQWKLKDDETTFAQDVTFSKLSEDFWLWVSYYGLEPDRIQDLNLEFNMVNPKLSLNAVEFDKASKMLHTMLRKQGLDE